MKVWVDFGNSSPTCRENKSTKGVKRMVVLAAIVSGCQQAVVLIYFDVKI